VKTGPSRDRKASPQEAAAATQKSDRFLNFLPNDICFLPFLYAAGQDCLPAALVQLYGHSVYIRELTNVLDTRLMVRTCPDGLSVAPHAGLIFPTARFHGGLGPFLTTRYGRASQNFRMEARA
jgi:hypothetical protein